LVHANDLTAKLAAGLLSPGEAAKAPQLIFNDRLNATLTAMFLGLTWVMVIDTLRVSYNAVMGRVHPPLSESPHVPSRLVEDWVRD
jgi:carbon starvation protein